MTPPHVLRFKNLGTVLSAGLLALTPIGTGFIKPIVNVFGAKQFHPLLQSTLVETYYVNFYVAINIGALVGGIAVPIAAGYSMVAAYSIPFVSMFLGYVHFLSMSKRFVKIAPEKTAHYEQRRANHSMHPKNQMVFYFLIPLSTVSSDCYKLFQFHSLYFHLTLCMDK